jgi:predicted RNA methylase
MNGIDRLLTLRQECAFAGHDMRIEAERFRRIEYRHQEGTAPRAVIGFNLFQTPRPIAARMAALIRERVGDGARILEPSAGLGRLLEPLDALRAQWELVEENAECCRALENALKRGRVSCRDFLGTSAGDLGGSFDAVVMNPPFKQGRDVKHIRHALDMLSPGGRLVSLCYNGTRQNAELRPMADHWEVLPENSFRTEGTAASVALLIIDK